MNQLTCVFIWMRTVSPINSSLILHACGIHQSPHGVTQRVRVDANENLLFRSPHIITLPPPQTGLESPETAVIIVVTVVIITMMMIFVVVVIIITIMMLVVVVTSEIEASTYAVQLDG